MTEASKTSLQEGGASPATPPAEAGGDGTASPVTPAPVSADPASTPAAAADAAPAPDKSADVVASEADTKPEPSLLSTAELPEKEAAKDEKSEAKEPAPDQKADAPKEEKADAKADAEKSKDDKAADAAPADKTAAQKPPVKYEPFKLPDGVKLDDSKVKEFTDVLDAADISPQDRAQKLVDFHVAEMNLVVEEQSNNQIKAWKDFTESLKSDYKKDSDLGGNRQDTSLGIAKSVIEQMGGTAEQKADLYKMLDHTGMGNYVGLARLLNNIYEHYMGDVPVPANPPTKAARGDFQTVMYGPNGQ